MEKTIMIMSRFRKESNVHTQMFLSTLLNEDIFIPPWYLHETRLIKTCFRIAATVLGQNLFGDGG
jgi:hypothetical protein